MRPNKWFIDSETGELSDVLLCPPDHYSWIASNDIAIRNLEKGLHVERKAMQAQFGELVSALEGAQVACHRVEARAGLPYQVYTRDSSQTTPWGTVVTRLMRPERRAEESAINAFYGDDAIWRRCTKGHIEGGDIHVIRPGLLAVGVTGGRTDVAGAEEFIGWFEEAGWTCRMIHFSEHFLHLDVIFCMVAENLAIACVDVIDDEDLAWFRDQGIQLLPVSYKEAMHGMGCNVLALGRDRVVSPRHSTRVNAMLRAEGIAVIDPELDQFSQGGGSIHCMSMPLRRRSLAASG